MVALADIGMEEGIVLGRLEGGDGELLRRFFGRLSPQSIYRRFFSPLARPEQAHPELLLDLDGCNRVALVGLHRGEIAPAVDADQLAWELGTLLAGANKSLLSEGEVGLRRAKRAIADRLDAVTIKARPKKR